MGQSKIRIINTEEHADDLFNHAEGKNMERVVKRRSPLRQVKNTHPLIGPSSVSPSVPLPCLAVTSFTKRITTRSPLRDRSLHALRAAREQFFDTLENEWPIVERRFGGHVFKRQLSSHPANVASTIPWRPGQMKILQGPKRCSIKTPKPRHMSGGLLPSRTVGRDVRMSGGHAASESFRSTNTKRRLRSLQCENGNALSNWSLPTTTPGEIPRRSENLRMAAWLASPRC